MNGAQALAYIHGAKRFGAKPGLERMRELMRRLGNPQDSLRFVHVAGTNGKGSVVTMLSCILQQAGYKTGKYISPYVFEFRERISVNGSLISESALARLTDSVRTAAEGMTESGWDALTEFEIVTAVGLLYFAEQKCDIVMLEVGLGGRFDATNIIETPLVSVILSISADHTAILGDTIEQIALEKCGIIKQQGCVICYPFQQQEAEQAIRRVCKEKHARFVLPDATELTDVKSDLSGSRFCYKDKNYVLNLVGKYQVCNALCVLETVFELQKAGYNINAKHMEQGLSVCQMDARFDKVCENPEIVLDAGHNPQGIDALIDILSQVPERKIIVIYAVMKDKDYRYAVRRLAGRAQAFYAVSLSDNARALSAQQIAEIAAPYCKDTRTFDSMQSAVDRALSVVDDELILICGSFYMMEKARKALKNSALLCFPTK